MKPPKLRGFHLVNAIKHLQWIQQRISTWTPSYLFLFAFYFSLEETHTRAHTHIHTRAPWRPSACQLGLHLRANAQQFPIRCSFTNGYIDLQKLFLTKLERNNQEWLNLVSVNGEMRKEREKGRRNVNKTAPKYGKNNTENNLADVQNVS